MVLNKVRLKSFNKNFLQKGTKQINPNISDCHALLFCDDPDDYIIEKLKRSIMIDINVIDYSNDI